jgi:hypothetical protein
MYMDNSKPQNPKPERAWISNLVLISRKKFGNDFFLEKKYYFCQKLYVKSNYLSK